MAIYFLLAAEVILLFLAVGFLIFEIYGFIIAPRRGSPYAPTRADRAETALALAGAAPGELLVDLGSGNGAVLIAAAQRGLRARGVEINPFLVWYSRRRIRRLGLDHLAAVAREDFFSHPLGDADIVFLYLVPYTMARLSEKMREEASTGARIIANRFPLPGWTPAQERDNIYLYLAKRKTEKER